MSIRSFENKKILVGITGSIAAYKAAELVRLLRQHGAIVKVVLSKAGSQFITPLTLQTLSNEVVYQDQWDAEMNHPMLHIELARWADCILIAPASADCIARIAHGHANDLLTSLLLATNRPIFIAPAMNQQMWLNPITQHNVQQLRIRKISILGPDTGEQACGDIGPGRMLEPELILTLIKEALFPPLFQKHKVLITAGPTYEAIDPVRYIANRSSGKMGYALAEAFANAGADVILVSGPSQLETPGNVHVIRVESAQEMYQAVMQQMAHCDIFIGAAAVCDYRIENPISQKIKKETQNLSINLIKNPDIISAVSALKNRPITIGFAAETHHLLTHASKKLSEKKLDMIIANLVQDQSPFNSDENEVWILINHKEPIHLTKTSKKLLAHQIKDLVFQEFVNQKEQIKT